MDKMNNQQKREIINQSVEISTRVYRLENLLQTVNEIAQNLNSDLDNLKTKTLSFHHCSLPDLQNVWELVEIDFDKINSIRLSIRGISESINVLQGLTPPPRNTNPN